MTLKEKFKLWLDSEPYFQDEECERIADDYAVDFAEWITQQPEVKIIKKSGLGNSYMRMSSKELLEIFKKEKRL